MTPSPVWPGRYFEYEPGQELVHGHDVAVWQTQMSDRGWDIDVDSQYGPQSRGVCLAFQEEKGLWQDGIVGEKTWVASFKAPVT